MRRAALALLVGLASSACLPPDELPTLAKPYSEETAMGIIQRRGEINIAVPSDSGLLGGVDPSAGRPRGLSVALGEYLAQTLGVDASYLPAPEPELVDLVEGGEADLAFSIAPLTEEAVRRHSFTDPYYVGHQRLLVPSSSHVDGVEDLAGRTVCAYVDPLTGVDLREIEPEVETLPATEAGRCAGLLESGRAQAATAVDASLASIAAELEKGPGAWKVVGDQLTTTAYAALVSPDATGFGRFVSSVLARASLEGVWARAYQDSLGPYLGERSPPELTLEEAAALYPSQGKL